MTDPDSIRVLALLAATNPTKSVSGTISSSHQSRPTVCRREDAETIWRVPSISMMARVSPLIRTRSKASRITGSPSSSTRAGRSASSSPRSKAAASGRATSRPSPSVISARPVRPTSNCPRNSPIAASSMSAPTTADTEPSGRLTDFDTVMPGFRPVKKT